MGDAIRLHDTRSSRCGLTKEEVVLGVILSEVKAAAIAQGPGVPHEVAC